jgi:membrane-bound metal-dependent hydrolase YbcI (DUF457 family)
VHIESTVLFVLFSKLCLDAAVATVNIPEHRQLLASIFVAACVVASCASF